MENNVNEVRSKNVFEKFCKDCGNTINEKAEICPKCGVRQTNILLSPNGKNKTIAALLAFFLGAFGIQFFYLGKALPGILSVLFCWTGIPSLIGLIHAILLFLSSEEDFVRKYGK